LEVLTCQRPPECGPDSVENNKNTADQPTDGPVDLKKPPEFPKNLRRLFHLFSVPGGNTSAATCNNNTKNSFQHCSSSKLQITSGCYCDF